MLIFFYCIMCTYSMMSTYVHKDTYRMYCMPIKITVDRNRPCCVIWYWYQLWNVLCIIHVLLDENSPSFVDFIDLSLQSSSMRGHTKPPYGAFPAYPWPRADPLQAGPSNRPALDSFTEIPRGAWPAFQYDTRIRIRGKGNRFEFISFTEVYVK